MCPSPCLGCQEELCSHQAMRDTTGGRCCEARCDLCFRPDQTYLLRMNGISILAFQEDFCNWKQLLLLSHRTDRAKCRGVTRRVLRKRREVLDDAPLNES